MQRHLNLKLCINVLGIYLLRFLREWCGAQLPLCLPWLAPTHEVEHSNCCLATSFNLIYSCQASSLVHLMFMWGKLDFCILCMPACQQTAIAASLCWACAPSFQRTDSCQESFSVAQSLWTQSQVCVDGGSVLRACLTGIVAADWRETWLLWARTVSDKPLCVCVACLV